MTAPLTIDAAIEAYLRMKAHACSRRTEITYRNALQAFRAAATENGRPPGKTLVTDINQEYVRFFIKYLSGLAPATEDLYVSVFMDFCLYLEAEDMAPINLAKINQVARMQKRRQPTRIPVFPMEDVQKLIDGADRLLELPYDDEAEHLRALRDRALILVLAESGLRIHEACNLDRGMIDYKRRQAFIVGKGDKQARVKFSQRSLAAVQDYLGARAALDGSSGKPLASLPVFARHDKGAGKKIKRITTRTGQNAIEERVCELVGPQAVGTITPHTLRHYFVTQVLNKTGNLMYAKELARHANVAITQRYVHLADAQLDDAYNQTFEE